MKSSSRFSSSLLVSLFLFLCGGVAAWAQPAYLVKDLHTGPVFSGGASFLAASDDLLFFWADLPSTGFEVWRSDGTAAGTSLLLDILPGPDTSDPNGSDFNEMVGLGSLMLFTANDGSTGPELWRSDGTPAGTELVADLNPGPEGSDPRDLTVSGGLIYFQAWGGGGRSDLWRSDGTAAGTFRISVPTDVLVPTHLTDVEGTLFFLGYDIALASYTLWKTDGFTATLVTDGVGDWVFVSEMAAVDDAVFFVTWNYSEAELWRSDGTEAGTTRVRSFGSTLPEGLTAVGGTLFFRATDAAAGTELWKSDGTDAGTVRVADLRPGPESSSPFGLTAFGDLLAFTADDGTAGRELWRSDGTEAGTWLLGDLAPGPESSNPQHLIAFGDLLFFSAYQSGSAGLWRTDGTAAGTWKVIEITDIFFDLVALDGLLYFAGFDGSQVDLWRSDGTAAGTYRVRESSVERGSVLEELVDANGTLFFRSYSDYLNDCALWKSDGTEAGTVPIPGPLGICPYDLTPVGSSVFFRWNGSELWKSDGTSIVEVATLGASSFGVHSLAEAGGLLYFNGRDDAGGRELWKSDGTAAGTVRVADVLPGTASSDPTFLTGVNGLIFFRAFDGVGGYDLWRSDGTETGTFLLRNSSPAGGYATINDLTSVAGLLFFLSYDGTQTTLWRTDGTPAGTFQVLAQGAGSLTAVGNLLFFLAGDEEGGGLWKSNGTPAGTVRVKLLPPDSRPEGLAAAGGKLFFSAFESATGRELWVSDGTDAGTHRVADLEPGPRGSLPQGITDAFGRAIFAAADRLHGQELWVSDGTPAGTFLLQDIAAGPLPSSPQFFTASGPRVFFSADDGIHGRELWAFAAAPPPVNLVTGAGWIESVVPAGKGHFQVWVRWKNGTPDGHVRFRVPAREFRSTTLSQFVIDGARARVQGECTLNGRGRYNFLLVVEDGQAPGGGGADRLRLRIWSGALTIYDTDPGLPDGNPPVRAIGGGSIVFHREGKN